MSHPTNCECMSWCRAYGVGMPGEVHHRDCKKWHRELGEAIATKTELLIIGQPAPDDESHNCDAMGCTTVSHVLERRPLQEDVASLVRTLRALIGEKQPLGIDRPTHQNALRELAKWDYIHEQEVK